MKKIIAIALAFTFAVTGVLPVTATDEAALSLTDSSDALTPVIVSGNIASGKAGVSVTLTICKKGKSPEDWISGEEFSDIVEYYNQTETIDEGFYSFQTKLQGSTEEYTAYVNSADEEEATIAEIEEVIEREYDFYSITSNFEDYTGGSPTGWTSKNIPDTQDAVTVDTAHGKSIGLYKTDQGTQKLYNIFNKELSEGVLLMSFDFYAQGADNGMIMRMLPYDWSGVEEEYLMYKCFEMNKGEAYAFYGDEGWNHVGTTTYTQCAWHKVSMCMDLNRDIVYWYFDDVLMTKTGISGDPMGGIFLTVYGGSEAERLCLDNISIQEVNYEYIANEMQDSVIIPDYMKQAVQLELETGKTGNIFYGNEAAELKLKIKNNYVYTLNTTAVFTLKDIDGVELRKASYPVSIEGYGEATINITPTLEKYGVYNLTADVGAVSRTFDLSRAVKVYEANQTLGAQVRHYQTKYRNIDMEKSFNLLANSGFSYTRVDVGWSINNNGTAQEPFYQFDKHLSEAEKRNMGNYVIVPLDNGAAEDSDGGINTSTANLDALKAAAEDFTSTYPMVEYIEVGNESNYILNNTADADGYKNAPASDYVKVLKAIYEGAKAGNKDVKVVAFATSIAYTGYYTDGYYEDYVTAALDVMKDEGAYYFDAISVHQYCVDDKQPEIADIYVQNKSWVDHGKRLREIMTEYDISDKETIISEFGYTAKGGITNEKEAAVAIVRMLALGKSYGLYDKMFLYEAIDTGIDQNYTEHNYGLVKCYESAETPYSAKPAYPAVANYNNLVGNATPILSIEPTAEAPESINLFEDSDGNEVYMVWSINGDTSYTISDIPASSVKVYDMYGNAETKAVTSSGNLTITLTEEPQYIVVPDINADFTKVGNSVTVKVTSQSNTSKVAYYTEYSAENALLSVKRFVFTNSLNETFDMISDAKMSYSKLFVWSNDESLKPLCDVITQ